MLFHPLLPIYYNSPQTKSIRLHKFPRKKKIPNHLAIKKKPIPALGGTAAILHVSRNPAAFIALTARLSSSIRVRCKPARRRCERYTCPHLEHLHNMRIAAAGPPLCSAGARISCCHCGCVSARDGRTSEYNVILTCARRGGS